MLAKLLRSGFNMLTTVQKNRLKFQMANELKVLNEISCSSDNFFESRYNILHFISKRWISIESKLPEGRGKFFKL